MARQGLVAIGVITVMGCVSGPLGDARRAMDGGDYELAARHYRQALAGSPGDVSVWLELGEAELRADRPARARAAYEKAATLDPRRAGIRVRIGMTHELERRYDEAILAYRHACEIDPSSAQAHRVLGTRLLRFGEPALAIAPLARAAQLDPSRPEIFHALGLAESLTGDDAAAEATFQRGLGRHGDDRTLLLALAAVLVKQRKFEAALAVYDTVVARAPELAAVHVGRALLLHELHRFEEADAAFAKAAELSPSAYAGRLRDYRALRARD